MYLYGYTNQQIDGLSFPDEVTEPDTAKVAAVTLEVMTLRAEVDMLIKVRIRFVSSHLNTLKHLCSAVFCVRDSLFSISYTSVHFGHPPSPRMLQRYHPIHHPGGLYKQFQWLCNQYGVTKFHINCGKITGS